MSAIGGGGVCPLRSIVTAGSSEKPGSTGGGVVAAVPSEGGALLSPFAERLASLSVELPPGNCDCQALGRAGCGGLSSSCLTKFTLDRDLDLESLRRPLTFLSSSLSPGRRLHLCVSAVSPDATCGALLPLTPDKPDRA